MTVLDYILNNIESVMDKEEPGFNNFRLYIIDLFTSQGLNNIDYLDFESWFPEYCHDVLEIIQFVEHNPEELSSKLREQYYIQKRMNRKPSKLLSDEYDVDDYELSQKISHIPFHL